MSRKPSKYRNQPTEVDGIRFDSKAEARRYGELKLMERAREISDLVLQPPFPIVVKGTKVATYKADFAYIVPPHGAYVVEDVKGVRTPLYKLKKKLVEALYGIEIVEIR